ncbi:MAG: 2'-5' RNA ligase family protein [Candidatus Yanofskybacteria bacterium]|nr:2'-5' RNA ligase family protein [Candidatus Yanofskybacteria bacterium]
MGYYIHIPLPEKLRDEISEIERTFQGDSGSEPHITLIPPRELIGGKSEQELIDAVHLATQRLTPFALIQKGVGFFGNKETIYVRISRTYKLVSFHQALAEAISGILEPLDGPFDNLPTPHITLSTRLSPEYGQKAWEVLRNRNFLGQFMCKRLTLLQKDRGDKHWKVLWHFDLNG